MIAGKMRGLLRGMFLNRQVAVGEFCKTKEWRLDKKNPRS
ncbi:MAG: hypothetical protein OFPII_25200 [Osedax symbiont Rs1]|nr:MAG: hypothetical protein OFPII_25200 [Osedax symbiont Rs1]